MPRIIYLSATPNQKTGTGSYLPLFLENVVKELGYDNQLVVTDGNKATDDCDYVCSIPVIDYLHYEYRPDDIVVAFIANNHFHCFVIDFIYKADQDAKIITVIHDPQIFMISAAMCREKYFGFDIGCFGAFIKHEAVTSVEQVITKLSKAKIPEIMKYTMSCQSFILEKSCHVIVHSAYARTKLQLEHRNSLRLPPISIGSHPTRTDTIAPAKSEIFNIGCFGWIARSKRPAEVINAFAKFVDSLDQHLKKKVHLKFVGQLTEKRLSPLLLAKKAGISQFVSHHGYLPAESFRKEMNSTNLIVNLRYPSCGETSGTLFQAIEGGQAVILSRYQAFVEEPASYHVGISPDQEEKGLIEAFSQEFQKWLSGDKGTLPAIKLREDTGAIAARVISKLSCSKDH